MEDRAKFLGYQECPGHAPLALYNVLDKSHRLYGSTVSAHTLAREKIPVPKTPKYYDPDQLAMGIKVEAEHLGTLDIAFTKTAEFIDKHAGIQARIKDIIRADKNDRKEYDKLLLDTATAIAKDHLDELPDYYTRLAKMEGEARIGSVFDTEAQKHNTAKEFVAKIMSLDYGDIVTNIPIDSILKSDFFKTELAKAQEEIKSGKYKRKSSDPIRLFADIKTNMYEMVDGYHRLAKSLNRGNSTINASIEYIGKREVLIDIWNKANGHILNQKSNPANKPYKGDTDVKAIGNIPAPGPGMMMVVNPGGPKKTSKDMLKEIVEEIRGNIARDVLTKKITAKEAAQFQFNQLKKGGITDQVANNIIELALNTEKKNPALLILNPSKLQRWHDKLDRHYQTLVRLAELMGDKYAMGKPFYGKKLSVALLKLENQAHKATTDYANGEIQMEDMDRIDDEVTAKVTKLFGKKLPGFFVNRDPRGYALKIDDKFMPRYEKVGLERDMGGYGILSPEISKENPAKVPCRYCGRPSEDKSGVCLVCANKYEKKNPVKDFNAPHILTQNGVKKCTGTANECLTWMQKHTSYSWDHAFKHEGWKLEPIHKTKKNPMVKDMTTYRQKQDIKADLKRMAQMPQRRQHPEFATLELAAEYVEKALGKVITIIQGKDSYIIRHAKGIAAFSTTKNNKLIML